MISQDIRFLGFVFFGAFFIALFAQDVQREEAFSNALYVRLSNGQYLPFIKSIEKCDTEKKALSEKSFGLKQKNESLIEKIRNFFVTPFNITLPGMGNLKNVYYQLEYHVTCAAQEFYEDVVPSFLLISKEQTVCIAHLYFFNLFAKWLTPTGIFDAVVSRILYHRVPLLALKYNFSEFAAVCTHQGLYSIYSIITKHLDTPWYIFAFLYHMGMRSHVNSYLKINRYAEMVLLGLCVPKMFNYLV